MVVAMMPPFLVIKVRCKVLFYIMAFFVGSINAFVANVAVFNVGFTR